MSQYDFGTIDPATKNGIDLATDLNTWRTALHSTHKGPTAPAYKQIGTEWIDDATAGWYIFKMWDGVAWVIICSAETTGNMGYWANGRLVLPTASAPTPVTIGDTWFDTTDKTLVVGSGVAGYSKRGAPTVWEKIGSFSGTGASINYTGLSAFSKIRIHYFGVAATDANTLYLRTSSNNGSSYDAGASDYLVSWRYQFNTTHAAATANATGFYLSGGNVVGNAANEQFSGIIELDQFNQATYCHISTRSQCIGTSGERWKWRAQGFRNQATARNAVQLILASGSFGTSWAYIEGART